MIEYLKLVWQIQIGEAQLSQIYADPTIADAEAASTDLRAQLEKLRSERDQQAPLAEAILQAQISETASQLGLTLRRPNYSSSNVPCNTATLGDDHQPTGHYTPGSEHLAFP